MSEKILILGGAETGLNELALQLVKEKYGADVILVTRDEAIEQGLKPEDFANVPKYDFTAPPMLDDLTANSEYRDGKAKRRQRRKEQRAANKKRNR